MTILRFFFVFSLFISSVQAAPAGKEAYATILKKVVQEDGVAWSKFGEEEKKLLSNHMEYLASTSLAEITLSNDQLAFWINAHNACVMKLILDHLPVEDVMKIPGFRDRLTCKILGTERTLVDIQSGVIRPMFPEPRVHFVLWWGTKGGPKLPNTPYDGATLEKALTEKTQGALKDPRFIEFKTKPANVILSPLFDWFKADFGPNDDAVMGFIKKNVPKDKASKVPSKLKSAKFMAFDWSLDRSTL